MHYLIKFYRNEVHSSSACFFFFDRSIESIAERKRRERIRSRTRSMESRSNGGDTFALLMAGPATTTATLAPATTRRSGGRTDSSLGLPYPTSSCSTSTITGPCSSPPATAASRSPPAAPTSLSSAPRSTRSHSSPYQPFRKNSSVLFLSLPHFDFVPRFR